MAFKVCFDGKYGMTVLTDMRVFAVGDGSVACQWGFFVGKYHGGVEASSMFLVCVQAGKYEYRLLN